MGTRERLITLFQESSGNLLSGEELSKILDVSRTSIWKHISQLRELGYQIDAIPSKGYKLITTPDLLVPEEISNGITSKLIGKTIQHFYSIESTNETANTLAEQGAIEGTIFIAEEQTSGKGRLGRKWTSPAGVNLYLSVLIKPKLPPYDAPKLTFLSVVALAETIKIVCNLNVQAKWPNDLLCNGKKVAGLLNEMSAEADRIKHIILGLGVNLNMASDQFPTDLRSPATSIFIETGCRVDRITFTRTLIEQLDIWYQTFQSDGFEPIREAWQSISNTLNRRVSIASENQTIEGIVTGLDEMGALLVQTETTIHTIYAGDVTLLDN